MIICFQFSLSSQAHNMCVRKCANANDKRISPQIALIQNTPGITVHAHAHSEYHGIANITLSFVIVVFKYQQDKISPEAVYP